MLRQTCLLIAILPYCCLAGIGAQMGILNSCDDAKTNLTIDWPNFDFHMYTCVTDVWNTDASIASLTYTVPNIDVKTDGNNVIHKCMNEAIEYSDKPPLRGDHRPNWAVYGEYLYLPPQRWLHNLEHGAIVLLYHPCVDQEQLSALRHIVTQCTRRYVITPYNLTQQRPLALLSWANKVEMNVVVKKEAVEFIKQHARQAPEDIGENGHYEYMLLKASPIEQGTELCKGL